ncbi:MAG TPA: hypothetical protein VGA77_15765 [Propylenella sp.]|jgi:hypothetical protein
MTRKTITASVTALALAGLVMGSMTAPAAAHYKHKHHGFHQVKIYKPHKVCGYVWQYGYPVYACWWR